MLDDVVTRVLPAGGAAVPGSGHGPGAVPRWNGAGHRPASPRAGANGVIFLASLIFSGLALAGAIAAILAVFPGPWTLGLGRLPWLASDQALFGLALDPLSCLMLVVITLCGFLVVLYSGGYMSLGNVEHPSDANLARYYFFVCLFITAMVGLVSSPNYFQLFLFWELTTLCSWGLISFYGDAEALKSAYKALLITHGAGLFLAAAVVLIYVETGSFAFDAINLLTPGLKSLVIAFMGIAALAKAAQFPFFTWLPTAMAAPTPASSYLHAAAMVKAGIYLLARLALSVDAFPPELGLALSVIAIVTMCLAVVLYFPQDDLKRLLAFSTIANLGYMVLGIAMGAMGSRTALEGGMLHLVGHSFTKSLLFLAVGAISYATGTRKIGLLSGLGRKMPVTALAFVLGAMAISGMPPFNMFWSKYLIVSGAIELSSTWGWTLAVLTLAESVAGFAWFLHIVHKVFFGPVSPTAENARDPGAAMLIPLIVLMAFSVLSTVFALPMIQQSFGG
ncbi:hydrogenase 4 subunit D [Rhodospirillum rubrum]|uniref:NADH dehydrogenase (Quinone) n=1 Tax=Rhodospirillum rubrum (strain ATCC 11170 / ATH 1.1.1 / DSM 467 / LMG 4362 / NCIMB 8255 / S1) TaxID=269796 RepID=Q2RXM6_RHORT|nr:hydrogenase 4 subunit D [Rhodospirillum rubrum]ABC21119.1 NADH dehydrogenase (quinone) [Rhodospirillum rubrum ATCC 11170]AEO46787.1 hydrogenase 4 subunit D [Rhodospirillum rubrum F11]MBK5952666.1 oxidoreductase [Rhodospirillum rubrum]QXG80811.1 hydrogenase 4 subunit D [Rhodospirillum rubrum]HAQ00281.1 oxidoreductase [Rhodospirillum rubrum]